MRNVLVVITALMVAAIVLAPSMGYTIMPAGKVNYTINSEKVNYTIGSGTPAHETVYSEEMAEHYPTYSIASTPVPYSNKVGAGTKYSVKLVSNPTKVETIGGYKSTVLGPSEKIGSGLKVPIEPENKGEQTTGASTTTPVVSNVTAGNVTTNVTANVTAPVSNVTAPVANVTSENVTGNATAAGNETNITAPK